MTSMPFAKRLSFIVCLSFAAVMVASLAEAQQVSVAAVDATVAVEDGSAQATFSVRVTNSEESPMAGVVVAFADGSTLAVGDVPARDSAVSQPTTKAVDLSTPSASVSVPVKVTFYLGDQATEVPAVLMVTKP